MAPHAPRNEGEHLQTTSPQNSQTIPLPTVFIVFFFYSFFARVFKVSFISGNITPKKKKKKRKVSANQKAKLDKHHLLLDWSAMANENDGFKFEQRHGKARVRVARVWRNPDGRQSVRQHQPLLRLPKRLLSRR